MLQPLNCTTGAFFFGFENMTVTAGNATFVLDGTPGHNVTINCSASPESVQIRQDTAVTVTAGFNATVERPLPRRHRPAAAVSRAAQTGLRALNYTVTIGNSSTVLPDSAVNVYGASLSP